MASEHEALVAEIRAAVVADVAELLKRCQARWMSVEDAASYAALSPESIRRLLSSGALTRHRPVRGRIVIDRNQLDSLISTSTAELRRGRGRKQ